MTTPRAVPAQPPFTLRARLITPLAGSGFLHLPDARLDVDAAGRIGRVSAWTDEEPSPPFLADLRPWVVMPGMVDLHVHLPQIPNAGLGSGLDLLKWLERYIFPLEHGFDRATAEAQVPLALRAFAAAGTTTIVAYAALWPESTDACFAAAETHGIRAVIGKVMMDRITYDERIRPQEILETSLRQSAELCERWHGRDDGRLRYAFTPRFAVSCTPEMLAESARLAAHYDAYWQTHVSEDAGEIDEVRRLFPGARDYLDVYERAGGVNERAILAHAIHLSKSEVTRLAASSAAVAHCPASNLFLSSGMMPAARYRAAGIQVGLGSDLAAGPEMSIFSVMRAAAVSQRVLALTGRLGAERPLTPMDWLRLGTLEGARALGMAARVGSLEIGKEADLIAVDVSRTAPLAGGEDPAEPEELMSRLIFRPHSEMVRGAWVRGRLLPA
ncbi:MAG TPA: amidohydrolase family protein [Candidatus Limnocylindrales bacterium]|nr:amidohydrolase family protein [Candidatus Limnocylindrales bacterium]